MKKTSDGVILVTGSSGLVGTALCESLRASGEKVREFDLVNGAGEDTRDAGAVARAMRDCRGVVHLAAVSRVAWAEREPAKAASVNSRGTENVAASAEAVGAWCLFASSREVYGHTSSLVDESFPLRPVNTYGRTKVAGERAVGSRKAGTIVRLSNVYGSVHDHADRVIPAFIRAALDGQPLKVEGPSNAFDFVHLTDAVAGLRKLVECLDRGVYPMPTQLVTGRATSLWSLAHIIVELANSNSVVMETEPRNYDVSTFCGDPRRARQQLRWAAKISVGDGLADLIGRFRANDSARKAG